MCRCPPLSFKKIDFNLCCIYLIFQVCSKVVHSIFILNRHSNMILHRWACLLKQQTRLQFMFSDQGKQTSVFCSQKQTEVCCFCFLFAVNKQKLPFTVSSIFHLYLCRFKQKKSPNNFL
jgi:hypothetical protein